MPRPGPDLTGRRFGRWAVLRRAAGRGPARWVCWCDCGTVRAVAATTLVRGLSRSCGCLTDDYRRTRTRPPGFTKRPVDLVGRRFGRLVVLRPERAGRRYGWRCRCDCGRETVVIASNLRAADPNTVSCGCARAAAGRALAAAARRSARRYCRRCGAAFEGWPRQLFCSPGCQQAFDLERRWPKRRLYCPVCGAEFRGRGGRVYCGERCKRVAGNQARTAGTLEDQLVLIRSQLEEKGVLDP